MVRLDDPTLWLCHYTRAETAFEKIIPSGRLLMNPYSKMRDPFENKRPVFMTASGGDDDEERQERLFWGAQEAVSRSRDRWCLLSLTRGDDRDDGDERHRPFRCPWARPRMWEQYAENHAGACLVFDRAQLLAALRTELANIGQVDHDNVRYTVGGFSTSTAASINLDLLNEITLAYSVGGHVYEHFEDFFLLKTDDWASEWEYRVLVRPTDPELDADPDAEAEPPVTFVGFGRALRYVIVGEKFPRWQLPGAQAVAEHAGIELRQMSWRHGRPWPVRLDR